MQNSTLQDSPKDKIMSAYDAWSRTKSPEDTKNLLNALDPQIMSALKSFSPGMEESLKLKAQILTMDAIKTYDPSKGMHLKSYVYQRLQPIQRVYGQRNNPIKVPERQVLDSMALAKYENEFRDKWDRDPSASELADLSGMSIKQITRIRTNKAVVSETNTIDPESGNAMVSKKEDPQEVWSHYVYYSLDPIDQRIYEMVTGFGGSKIYKKGEIAVKLKLTPAAVSQRINKIAAKLQEGINLG